MDPGFPTRMIAACAVIGIVLIGLRYLLPVAMRGRANGSPNLLRVLASTTIAPNTSVHIVRAADRVLVLGGGSGHVTVLAELDAAALDANPPAHDRS